MKKITGLILMLLLILLSILSISFAVAHGEEDFAEAEEIISQKTPCSQLSENQLEIIGDFYMEQMHPGELHEIMDEMMGGEGSESLRIVHINMARAFYCGEPNAMSYGMMSTVMGRGMMGSSYGSNYLRASKMMGNFGMMSGYGSFGTGWTWGLTWLFYVALTAMIFGIVFWGTYKLIIENKNVKTKSQKRRN